MIRECNLYLHETQQRPLLAELYRKVFFDDNNFWFLYEGEYVVIRYSDDHEKQFLDRVDPDIIGNGCSDWIDSSEEVEKHKLAFSKIMHECAVIALSQEYEPGRLFERITHCVFLIFADGIEKENSGIPGGMLEAQLYSSLALQRVAVKYYGYGIRDAKK